jgi:protein TorT
VAVTNRAMTALWIWVLAALVSHGLGHAAEGIPEWDLEVWQQPFRYDSPSHEIQYRPLATANRQWKLCVSYPHMKDAYWLNVNYGMVQEARRLGVTMELVEAGGYPNLERQLSQIERCVREGADALIVGAVSYEGLTAAVTRIASEVPVLATVNDIQDDGITAKSGVSWVSMGRVVGEYLAERHPMGSDPVKVAWFPGPLGAGWVTFIERGFREGITEGALEVVTTKWGDTGKEIQRTLVQEALEEHPDIDYIVGNALTAEAAISVLRARGLEDQVGIVSTYFTHGVFRGIKRGRILAAPTDSPVLQGRLSIDQAVRVLERQPFVKHAGPSIILIHGENLEDFNLDSSLAPPSFLPTFKVN